MLTTGVHGVQWGGVLDWIMWWLDRIRDIAVKVHSKRGVLYTLQLIQYQVQQYTLNTETRH